MKLEAKQRLQASNALKETQDAFKQAMTDNSLPSSHQHIQAIEKLWDQFHTELKKAWSPESFLRDEPKLRDELSKTATAARDFSSALLALEMQVSLLAKKS